MIHDEDPSDSTPGICPLSQAPDLSDITRIELHPGPPLGDYLAAMRLAEAEALKRLGGDYMLLSWYDRDRDFESPQYASEWCPASRGRRPA